MRKKTIIGILLFLTFIVCIAIGVYIYKIMNISDISVDDSTGISKLKITDECTKESEELALVNSIEKKLSPNATFIMKTEYTKCGHTTKKYETAPPFTVNLTQKDLEKMYENWKIESFSNKEVVMKKIVDGVCDEHFLIKNSGGEIVVYQIDENNHENLLNKTGIMIRYLPYTDRDKIEKGIRVNGREALNKLLENYE